MEEAKNELKQLLIEKKRSYARYVSDVHKPQRSMFKAKELENLKDSLKHPVRQSKKFTPGTSVPLLPNISQNRSFQGFNRTKNSAFSRNSRSLGVDADSANGRTPKAKGSRLAKLRSTSGINDNQSMHLAHPSKAESQHGNPDRRHS